MSTWHQRKAKPVPLWHETLWTVVVDPPNGMCCGMRFETAEDADDYRSKVAHSYVLPPYPGKPKCPA